MRGTEGRSGRQEQSCRGAEEGRGGGCGRRGHLHHHDGLNAALSNLKKLQTRCIMEDGEKAELVVVVRLGAAEWESGQILAAEWESRPIFEPSTISSSSAATYPASSCEFVQVDTPHPPCQREDTKLVGYFQVLEAGRQTQV